MWIKSGNITIRLGCGRSGGRVVFLTMMGTKMQGQVWKRTLELEEPKMLHPTKCLVRRKCRS